MCGIVGYIGKKNTTPILIDGLRRESYRGYDSSGLVVFENGKPFCIKAVGKLEALEKKLKNNRSGNGIGLGHVRWATHGGVTENNAHPHCDCRGNIWLVHNDIIENYKELKSMLQKEGGKVRRIASFEGCLFFGSERNARQLNVKKTIWESVITKIIVPRFAVRSPIGISNKFVIINVHMHAQRHDSIVPIRRIFERKI